VRDIYMLGRRGPAQAAFTNPELKEFGALAEADVVVSVADATLDPLSANFLASNPDALVAKNMKLLAQYAARPLGGKPKRIHMRFLVSPTEIIGTPCVQAIKIVKNELYAADDGSLRPRATTQEEVLPVGLVFRSIGYKGVPLPDVPFDPKNAVIPNKDGRVMGAEGAVQGEYVVGWIKRGPSGIIGTNKPDSVKTVESLLQDMAALPEPVQPSRESMEAFLQERQPAYVTLDDWHLIDQNELEAGKTQNRPRVKFSRTADMLAVIAHEKNKVK
jgi:ferredoxin/flavodoxin---NADP+ reductase